MAVAAIRSRWTLVSFWCIVPWFPPFRGRQVGVQAGLLGARGASSGTIRAAYFRPWHTLQHRIRTLPLKTSF
jgi:hypothetical protein